MILKTKTSSNTYTPLVFFKMRNPHYKYLNGIKKMKNPHYGYLNDIEKK